MDVQLSKNFNLSEFIASPTATAHDIDNTPPHDCIVNLKLLVKHILQPARDYMGEGLRITSGYRCHKLNKLVGGSPSSHHVYGCAADIIPISGDTLKLAKWIAHHCEFNQLILEFGTPAKPEWIHVAYKLPNRKQILRSRHGGRGTEYVNIAL